MWRTVLAGLPAVENQHQSLVGVGRGAADGVGHRCAVRVDAEIGGGDHETDHRRAPGGKVAGRPVGAVTERGGEPGDPFADLGSHTVDGD